MKRWQKSILGFTLCLGGIGLVSHLSSPGPAFTFLGVPTVPSPSVSKLNQDEDTSVKPITLIFAGDMQFDRYMRTVVRSRGWDALLDESVQTLLAQADWAVANLEGPITDNPSVSETSLMGEAKNYLFTFSIETANYLSKIALPMVNIGNNHILNFGNAGVISTKAALEAAGVKYFGSPLDGDDRAAIVTLRGMKFGFVNFNAFVSGGQEKASTDIANLRPKVDVLIVYTHWGVEYAGPTEPMRTLAHAWIDAGVDVVIGSHPHVVQEHEVYRGHPIYYSLGNFIFDQYFRPETQQGLLVEVAVDPATHAITTRDIPIFLHTSGETRLQGQK